MEYSEEKIVFHEEKSAGICTNLAVTRTPIPRTHSELTRTHPNSTRTTQNSPRTKMSFLMIIARYLKLERRERERAEERRVFNIRGKK